MSSEDAKGFITSALSKSIRKIAREVVQAEVQRNTPGTIAFLNKELVAQEKKRKDAVDMGLRLKREYAAWEQCFLSNNLPIRRIKRQELLPHLAEHESFWIEGAPVLALGIK